MARPGKTKVIGLGKVARNMVEAGERWLDAVKVAIYLEANNVMAISQRRVPVDVGALKGSAYVTLPQEKDGRQVVEMGYGGAAKSYALYVHEIPPPEEGAPHPDQWEAGKRTARHEVGGWKYLERPVDERTPQIAHNIVALAKAAFEASAKPAKGSFPESPEGAGGGTVKRRAKKAAGVKKTKKGKGAKK